MGKFITSVRFKVKEGKSEGFFKKSKEIGKYEQAIEYMRVNLFSSNFSKLAKLIL